MSQPGCQRKTIRCVWLMQNDCFTNKLSFVDDKIVAHECVLRYMWKIVFKFTAI